MRTIDAMIEATQVARRASTAHLQADGGRNIEIVLTEVGLVVRGRTRVGARTAVQSMELRWPEFDGSPHLLANGVRLVADRLAAAERKGP